MSLRRTFTNFVRDFDLGVAGKWLILGTIVGVVGGLGAILFQTMLQVTSGFLLTHLAGIHIEHPGGEPPAVVFSRAPFRPWLVVLLPALGGLASGLIVTKLAPEAAGHGTDAAIRSYHNDRGIIHWRVPVVKMVASVITLGTGGSGGREGPIAQIGAGFGSFLAQRLGLSTRTRRWLLAAGIGAGVGSIFRAPLAGAVFAGEVLYSSTEVETEVLLPATVASIVAYSVFAARFGWGHMFTGVPGYDFTHPVELLPYLVLAGVVAGAAWVYVKVFYAVHERAEHSRVPKALRPMIGGLATGLVALALYYWQSRDQRIFNVFSAGYGILQETLARDGATVGVELLLVIAIGKLVTTSLSIGSGGSGGVFGPSMVIGGTLGAAVGKVFHELAPGTVPHVAPFAIVGMAGFFAAAANTPISTVIMVSELTGNYKLLVPAMWVCCVAFLAGRRWSIFRNQMPNRVASPVHYGEQARLIFATTQVGEIFKMDRRVHAVRRTTPLREVLRATTATRQRLFPVVEEATGLVGTFHQDDLLGALQDPKTAVATAAQIMSSAPLLVRPSDTVATAQRLMRIHQVDEILIVDEETGIWPVGILTGADILLSFTRAISQRTRGSSVDPPGSGALAEEYPLADTDTEDVPLPSETPTGPKPIE
jgi:chloride channel protein, CIC family